jgi:hypothetical protein
MRPSNDSVTPSSLVSNADRQRQEREVINNRWNKFASWVTPKVKRVVEVATPIVAGTPPGRILDPRDGLVRRGLDVIDQALESKDPEYKAKVIESIKSGLGETFDKANELFLPSTEDLVRGFAGGPGIGMAKGRLATTVAASGADSRITDAFVEQAYKANIEEQAEAKTSTWLTENVYDPTNQTVGAATLALNPDTREEAARRGIDPLTLAWEERANISTGQAAFDLIAGESAFGADNIYDELQRQELFYGEGFVSNVARGASGTIDLGAQLVFDPLVVGSGLFKLGRLATLDVKTVAESKKRLTLVEQAMAGSGMADEIVSKPSFFEESFFKGGKKDIEEYRIQRAEQDANIARIKELEDDELLYSFRMGNAQDEIGLLSPGDPEIARLTQVANDSKQKLIEIKTLKDEIKSKPAPTISAGWDEFYNQLLSGMKVSEIYKHKRLEIFGAGRDRIAAAFFLAAKTGDKRDLIDLTLLATNVDPQAGARLLARRDSIKPIIEDFPAQIREIHAEVMAIMNDSPFTAKALEEVKQDQIKIFKALRTEDKFLRAAIGEEEELARSAASRLPNAGIARIPTFIPGNEAMTRSIERFRARQAKTRASVAMDRSLAGDDFIVKEFQISPLARPVYVAQWVGGKFGRYHPSNTIAIEGFDTADGIDELASWMQSAPLWGKTTFFDRRSPEFRGAKITPDSTADARQKLLDNYIIAQGRTNKEKALLKIERAYAGDVLRSLGYQPDEAEVLIELFMKDKAKKIAMFRQENGFYPDPDVGGLMSAPMMAKELEYRHLMMDAQEFYNFALLEKDAMQPIFRLVLDETKDVAKAVDFIERSFRANGNSLEISSIAAPWFCSKKHCHRIIKS